MVNSIVLRIVLIAGVILALRGSVASQTKPFIPVEGATLKAKIESAVLLGRNNSPAGRFWVGYQFEVRPGVATDFEAVDNTGEVYISMD